MCFSDVTKKVKSQDDLYHQNKDMQQFTYIVPHNLRAPLANALGLVDLLDTAPRESTDYPVTLGNLKTSVEQLGAVLRDINTILSIRDQQDMAQPELVPLADMVHQASINLQEPLREVGGVLSINVPADLRVRANRAYLNSVFFNLLSDAVKYRAETHPLRAKVSATTLAAGGVEIVVVDNGSGFNLKHASVDVFRLYKRFHAGATDRGIRLYLVKIHVKAMGGTIEVDSAVNVGTRFIIHSR